MQLKIKKSQAMKNLGAIIATHCIPGIIIYLNGPLGTGKTTFVRGFLRGLGYIHHVNSPTFNLFEIYQIKNWTICHFDLYRIINPEEIIYIGASDYFNENNVCLLEWAKHGVPFIPNADLICEFRFCEGESGRIVNVESRTVNGDNLITGLLQYQ